MNDLAAKLALPARWLMVAAIAYTLAQSVLYFVSPPASQSEHRAEAQRATQARASVDVNAILASNLFGAADRSAPAAEQTPTVATRLPLELLGVFVADKADNSAAIISQRGRQGLLYTIGDDVPGNATLAEVQADHVILRRAGVRETLHFPSPAESIAARSRFDTAPLQVEDDYVDEYIDTETYDEPYEDGAEDSAADSAEAAVSEYRERLEADPAGALEELGVSPVSDGAAEGYRIGDLAQSPYLSQTGLQPGDVILSVNGRPVGDLDQDRLELDNVLAEGSARLEIQRGTRRFFVTASLQQ